MLWASLHPPWFSSPPSAPTPGCCCPSWCSRSVGSGCGVGTGAIKVLAQQLVSVCPPRGKAEVWGQGHSRAGRTRQGRGTHFIPRGSGGGNLPPARSAPRAHAPEAGAWWQSEVFPGGAEGLPAQGICVAASAQPGPLVSRSRGLCVARSTASSCSCVRSRRSRASLCSSARRCCSPSTCRDARGCLARPWQAGGASPAPRAHLQQVLPAAPQLLSVALHQGLQVPLCRLPLPLRGLQAQAQRSHLPFPASHIPLRGTRVRAGQLWEGSLLSQEQRQEGGEPGAHSDGPSPAPTSLLASRPGAASSPSSRCRVRQC